MTTHSTDVPAQRSAPPPGAPDPGAPHPGGPQPATVGTDLGDVPTGELVRRLSTQLSELFRRELDLARTELTAKGKRAGAGAGLAGAGGVVALLGVATLIAAAVAGLATVVPVWLSALIIGVVLLLVAGVLALVGRGRLRRATPPVPEQAVQGVQSDVSAVRNAVHR
ncbi:phage holin family protein [Pseudonocardia adelaidensis]|uniref:Superfamily III holin-X n=1 Tax=Pseudonocardia adelaidensis TaxID=648754 RepID=A0ABP9NZ22_9PSEU